MMTKLAVTISITAVLGTTALAGPGSGAGSSQTDARAQAIQQAKDAGVLGSSAKGDKAAGLARALKYAGVKPATAKGARTFKVASLGCWSSKEGEDEQLGDYKCTLDKAQVKDGVAFLLQNAMEAAGIPSNDHMSQHTTDATKVSCVIDPAKSGDDRFACTWTNGK